jgi:hypothetical protein
VTDWLHRFVRTSVNSVNQSINQSTNRPTNQSTNQPQSGLPGSRAVGPTSIAFVSQAALDKGTLKGMHAGV